MSEQETKTTPMKMHCGIRDSIIVSPMMVMPTAMILLVLRCQTAEGTAVWCILPAAGGKPQGGDPEGTVGGGGGGGARGGSRGRVRAVMALEAVVMGGGKLKFELAPQIFFVLSFN